MANWSMMKRSILIGSLSGPNFVKWTAKMDHSRINFAAFHEQKKTVFYVVEIFFLHVWRAISVELLQK